MAVTKISLQQAMKQLNKTYGEASIFTGKEALTLEVPVISSGCLAIDYALKTGGIPLGRLIEVYGMEASGKTMLTLNMIAEFQRQDPARKCVFIDGEQTLTREFAESFGVNFDELIVTQPDTLEQALDTMATLASTGEVSLIALDSVPALPTITEETNSAGKVQVASVSKVLTPALRKFTPLFAKNKCTAIFINQVRQKIGVLYGDPSSTPGGNALKFGCSLRIRVGKVGGSDIKDSNDIVGHRVRMAVKKNKLSTAQSAQVEFTLIYGQGIDKIQDAIDTALLMGDKIIERPNTKTYIFQDLKIVGRDNFIAALKEDTKLLNTLIVKVRTHMNDGVTKVQTEEELGLENNEESTEES